MPIYFGIIIVIVLGGIVKACGCDDVNIVSTLFYNEMFIETLT